MVGRANFLWVGTIGTGLFLGTSKSLAQGGPGSMFIAYSIVGSIVYVTLLLLGEMATQYPVAGMYDCYISSTRCTDDQRRWTRFIQHICLQVLLPFVLLRIVVQLLVQRRCLCCLRPCCGSDSLAVLDRLAPLGHQLGFLGISRCRKRCICRGLR
jgi:hypothetical protein